MPDYNQLLAEMVARARPQQAPGGHGAAHVGGGGGGGIINLQNTNETMMKADVDIGQFARMLGIKPDEWYDKAAKQFQEMGDKMDPAQRKQWLASPPMQRVLEKMSKKNGQAYFDTNDGMWTLPQGSEVTRATAQLGGQPSAPSIAAGFAGEQPRKNLINSIQQEKLPPEYSYLTMQEIAENVRKKMGLEIKTAESKIGKTDAEAKLDSERAKVVGSLAQSEIDLRGKQGSNLAAQSKLHDAQAKEILEGMGKEQKALALKSMQDFTTVSKTALGDIYSDTQSVTRRPKINKLGSLVIGHVAQMKQISKKQDPSLAAGPASEYVSMVSQELQQMPGITPGKLYGTNPPPEADIKQSKIFLNDHNRLMQEFGNNAPKPLVSQMLQNVTQIAQKTPLTDDMKPTFLKWLMTAAVTQDEDALRNLVGVLKQKAPKWLEKPMAEGQ